MITTILFYLFATILVLSALRVITANNPVHAVLFLVLAFVTSSCLWIMLNVEFLALTLILVYVGAVMVLFLFIVMMLDIDIEEMRRGFWKNLPMALIIGVVIEVEMILVLVSKPVILSRIPLLPQHSTINTTLSNSYQLGFILYTEFSYPVELASLILLLGLVAAVALTLRKTTKNGKYQNIRKQVAVRACDRFEMIKMPSEVADKGETA